MNEDKFAANGWSAALPAGWEDRSTITLIGETDDNDFAANIVVTRQKVSPAASIEDFAAEQAELMRREVKTIEIIDERATTISNLPSFQRLQRFTAGELAIQQVQTFILSGDTIYAITGTASLAAFDRSIPAFKEFVETFEPTRG